MPILNTANPTPTRLTVQTPSWIFFLYDYAYLFVAFKVFICSHLSIFSFPLCLSHNLFIKDKKLLIFYCSWQCSVRYILPWPLLECIKYQMKVELLLCASIFITIFNMLLIITSKNKHFIVLNIAHWFII